MKGNKKLKSIRRFCLCRKKKEVTSHVSFCVGQCCGRGGSSQKKDCEVWWHSSFVLTIVSFSPVCDVEPSFLLCSPTFYSFCIAPFRPGFRFLQCWPHSLNLLFLPIALFTAISQPPESTPPPHTCTDTQIPKNALPLLISSTMNLDSHICV